jgi:arsenite methyltransferase
MRDTTATHEQVKDYYGKTLSGTQDIKTSACCALDSFLPAHRAILAEIDSEILDRFYGCGSPIPLAIQGCTVLDLGSGTGRDVYLASKLVGPKGLVIGVDMTDEQLAIARRHVQSQMQRFGFKKANVEFRQGYIENLAACGIADNSVDVVISNCVLNLAADKEAVFAEIFRVLKPGGELYFSDVFADRRIPAGLKEDPVLYGECLGGALYAEDFRRLLAQLGCNDYRITASRPIAVTDRDVAARTGQIRFFSRTVRAFKLASLEDRCEDYGQVATYKGTIAEYPLAFPLDDHHSFITGKPMLVCGNTAAMLEQTRFAAHFTVRGDRSVHFGAFPCGPAATETVVAAGSCC